MLKPILASILDLKDLTQDQAFQAMEIIIAGQATDAQIAGYLVGLRMKGETVDEIIGSARAMRSAARRITPDISGPLLDTAGTGGDGSRSINISTMAAIVIAGAGYKVAKHGNRAVSSSCGSADVLEELGVAIDLRPVHVRHCIEQVGIGFMFAPRFHPSMKHAIAPRRQLGQRTIMNMLGPLTNPANSSFQLLGVYDPSLTEKIALVLMELGLEGALVVHGHGGLDELSTGGINRVSMLRQGRVLSYELDGSRLGLRAARHADLIGGSPMENAGIVLDILSGNIQGPRKDVVLLNAAAALQVVNGSFSTSLHLARNSLESGAALEKLGELVSTTQMLARSQQEA